MLELELKVLPLSEPMTNRADGTVLKADLDYRDELLDLLRFFGAQGGIDLEEMQKALTVRAKIKSKDSGEKVELERAEAEYLLNRVKSARFSVADEAFITFRNDIKALLL